MNYAASKGGIALLMKSIAQELASFPHPGEQHRARAPSGPESIAPRGSTAEAEEKTPGTIPYGRIGEPADIANAALWLASDESDYVHGTDTVRGRRNGPGIPGFARGG